MKKRFAAVLFTTCFLLGSALGRQQTSPSASQTPPTKENQQHSTTQKNPDEVVRISVTLVQVDVAVTDRKGQPVTGGSLLLGKELQPGDYALQLIVTDRLAREENRAVGQWIDFEIVK